MTTQWIERGGGISELVDEHGNVWTIAPNGRHFVLKKNGVPLRDRSRWFQVDSARAAVACHLVRARFASEV